MRFFLMLLIVTGSLTAAPVPKDFKKPKTDFDSLQGVWVITESITNGRVTPGSLGIRYIVKGNSVRLERPESVSDSTITLDEKNKTYRWETIFGIYVGRYRFDGNKLLMVGRRGNVLPDDMKSGPTVEYDVMKRTK